MSTTRTNGNMLNQKYVTKRPQKKPQKKVQESPWTKMGDK